jgi:hypothetical protein
VATATDGSGAIVVALIAACSAVLVAAFGYAATRRRDREAVAEKRRSTPRKAGDDLVTLLVNDLRAERADLLAEVERQRRELDRRDQR